MPLSLVWNSATGAFDLAIQNGQLATGNDYTTLFMTQLLTSNVEASGFDPWAGNSFTPYPVGSRLPLLIRAVKSGNGNLLYQARDYAKECLMPFQDIGIISNLAVNTVWESQNGTLAIIFYISANIPGQDDPIIVQFGLNTNGTTFLIE